MRKGKLSVSGKVCKITRSTILHAGYHLSLRNDPRIKKSSLLTLG